jgi:hypothetical protein
MELFAYYEHHMLEKTYGGGFLKALSNSSGMNLRVQKQGFLACFCSYE